MLMGVAACASKPPASDPEALAIYRETNDPLEPMNRAILKFNQGMETVILKPVAKGYKAILPAPARRSVYNALHNLKSPVILINDVLQGEGERAGQTFLRFLINSTIGIGGLIDVADKVGLPSHDEDFGQTLAVHGGKEGAYLVLPLFGPSSLRDGFGLGVDVLLDPLFWILRAEGVGYLNLARLGLEGIDRLARNLDQLEDLQQSSLDYYAALRSAYRQNRSSEIANGREEELDLPDYLFDEEFEDEDWDNGGESE